jgi:hypothetical protein
MQETFHFSDVLAGKNAKQKATILKDKLTTQIFVCLYLCSAHCATDPTCPWKVES